MKYLLNYRKQKKNQNGHCQNQNLNWKNVQLAAFLLYINKDMDSKIVERTN